MKISPETLAIELDGMGIHVQALCPGLTLSEFHDDPQYAQYHIKERVLGWLWMTCEQVAKESLRALGEGQIVYFPGWQNRLIVAAARSGLYTFLLGVLEAFLSRSRCTVAEKGQLARQ